MAKWLKRIWKSLVCLLAAAFVVELLVGFFGVPGFVGRWFVTAGDEKAGAPQYVIVLGGGGIPSESGLMRTYYAAEMRKEYTGLTYVVSLPCEGDPATNSVGRMRDELVMRGVPASSILMEYAARNTHEQAVNIAKMMGPATQQAEVRLVTSSWHMRRAIACFQAAGFQHLGGTKTINQGAEADPGSGVLLRYAFWANLTSGIECLRECTALLVYKLRGWI
ncbi:MAG: YdcF family protein [Lentisphaerota bacterium]